MRAGWSAGPSMLLAGTVEGRQGTNETAMACLVAGLDPRAECLADTALVH